MADDLHAHDPKTWLETVWEGLHLIHPQAVTEEQHDDLMTAMHWITEHMGFEWDTQPDSPTNGELIQWRTE
ncbi:hypothetical protein CRP9_gp06 [Roseobacter phage CRP-9]|nr:hypothetical protein CRP9_gp06 [Roseobacter phage CRP-9]